MQRQHHSTALYEKRRVPSRADTEVHKNIIKRRSHLKCALTEHYKNAEVISIYTQTTIKLYQLISNAGFYSRNAEIIKMV